MQKKQLGGEWERGGEEKGGGKRKGRGGKGRRPSSNSPKWTSV